LMLTEIFRAFQSIVASGKPSNNSPDCFLKTRYALRRSVR